MMTRTIQTCLFAFTILMLTPAHAGGVLGNLFADIGKGEVEEGPLVNGYQLEKVLTALGNRRIDDNNLPSMHYYSNIKYGSLNGGQGYTTGVSANIRATGLRIDYGSSYKVKYYALPSLFYFPDDPKKNMLRFTVRTANINAEIADKIIADVKESIVFKEVNGEKDWSIVYGQTVLENTKTTLKADGKQLIIESLVDISNMNTEDALDYFSYFQNKISNLHSTILGANKRLNVAWLEEQDAREEEEREARRKEEAKMMNQHWGEISKPALRTLSIYISDEVENPLSDLGHWEYTHENGAFIEEINHGKYFEMLYILSSRDSASKENLDKMYKELTSLAEKNAPKGTASIDVRQSRYNNFTEIALKYNLDNKPTGEDIWDYTKGFNEFVADIHDDAEEIRDKYAQKLTKKEFETLSKEDFIEVVNEDFTGIKDTSDAHGAKGYWEFYEESKSGGGHRRYVIGNFDDYMLLSFIFHDFSDKWTSQAITEGAKRLKEEIEDESFLDADSYDVDVITFKDDPLSVWIQFKIKYKKSGMFSSGGMKGSTIREKYQDFKTKLVPQLSKQLVAHARAAYNE